MARAQDKPPAPRSAPGSKTAWEGPGHYFLLGHAVYTPRGALGDWTPLPRLLWSQRWTRPSRPSLIRKRTRHWVSGQHSACNLGGLFPRASATLALQGPAVLFTFLRLGLFCPNGFRSSNAYLSTAPGKLWNVPCLAQRRLFPHTDPVFVQEGLHAQPRSFSGWNPEVGTESSCRRLPRSASWVRSLDLTLLGE